MPEPCQSPSLFSISRIDRREGTNKTWPGAAFHRWNTVFQRSKTGTKALYPEIEKKLLSDFKGWRLGIILPSKEALPHPLLKLQWRSIFHGGLDIFAGTGII